MSQPEFVVLVFPMVDQVILWIDRSISDSLFFFLLSLSLSLSLSSCCDAWLEKKFVVLNLFFAGLLYWHLLAGSPQYFHWQFWLSTPAASFHQGIACRWCMFCSFLWVTFRPFQENRFMFAWASHAHKFPHTHSDI